MKRLRLLYIIPTLIALIVAITFIFLAFPPEYQPKAALAISVPLLVLGIGFRLITRQRIQIIRNQLYQILQTLEEFDVDEPSKVAFEESPFPIFNELNEYLIELIDRISRNFQANKQFTQNASHELQTPLAIIKGHIEILLQSPRMAEKEFESLAVVLQNTNRLSRLNSALILLSKIEHQRFGDTEMVNFPTLIDEISANFKDHIQIQEIAPTRCGFKVPFSLSIENDGCSPVSGQYGFILDSPTLSLFDVTGRQVQSVILKDATQQISTAHLSNGLYFYQVISADGQMAGSGKVVKH